MPTFTIERSYDVPHFRHATYEALSLEEALRMDAENDNWDNQRDDYECCGAERVTGAWAGDSAYEGECLLGKSQADAITTRDIGFAIRDFLDSRTIHHFEEDEDKGPADWISGIDISDPHNPVIFMSGGRKFVVRIIRQG